MQSYKLRVNLSSVTTDQLLKKLPLGDSIYACEMMDTSNPHIHFFIRTDVPEMTMRARLRALGLQGNKSYSLKGLDEDYPIEYIAYVTKCSEYVSTLNEKILSEALQYDKIVKKELKDKKSKKKSTLAAIDTMISDWTLEPENLHRIMNTIIKYHIENDLQIRKFQIQAYFDTLMCRHSQRYSELFALDMKYCYDMSYASTPLSGHQRCFDCTCKK